MTEGYQGVIFRMTIQQAQPHHTDAVQHVTHSTIRAVYPRYYPEGAVAFFLQHHAPENIRRDVEQGLVYVALEEDGTVVGTVTVRGNDIGRLFVLPRHQGQGVGRRLMQFAEALVFARHDTAELSASLPAKALYLKNGYRAIGYHILPTDNGDFLCYDQLEKSRP